MTQLTPRVRRRTGGGWIQGSHWKRAEGLRWPSTEDSRGEGKAEEIFMTKNVFFLSPYTCGVEDRLQARDRHAGVSLRGLQVPPHTSPSSPFPRYWFYTSHNLICAIQASKHPSSWLFARERDLGKRVPNAKAGPGDHKVLPFPLQPRKGPQRTGRSGAGTPACPTA